MDTLLTITPIIEYLQQTIIDLEDEWDNLNEMHKQIIMSSKVYLVNIPDGHLSRSLDYISLAIKDLNYLQKRLEKIIAKNKGEEKGV